jgi:hypothetical protein
LPPRRNLEDVFTIFINPRKLFSIMAYNQRSSDMMNYRTRP